MNPEKEQPRIGGSGSKITSTASAARQRAEELFFTRNSLDSGRIRKPRVNCAEALLRAYLGDNAELPAQAEDFHELGYGNADGGRCGAMVAGEHILKLRSPGNRQRFIETFSAEAGEIHCRSIKRHTGTSCAQCVSIAASLLDNMLSP